MPKTTAERMRAYRARCKEAGKPAKGGKRGKQLHFPTKWDNGYFVALDGEGASIGNDITFQVGNDDKTYKTKEHIYTLLAASTGESLYNGGNRLDSQPIIDWLLDLSASHKRGIFVIFAGSYDINHMLMYGFERDILQRISRGETVEYDYEGVRYAIEYRARKSLTLRRGLSWNDKKQAKWKHRITVWDVFGFFQENFVGVIGKWLGKDWKHYGLIKEMKAKRGDFAAIEQPKINAYNAAELETLAVLMEKVRDAISGLEMKCNRWDGAGAVAGALLRKHKITEFKKPIDEKVSEAVRCAYAGGRIEVCKIGYHNGVVYDYDVNSAYPSVMAELPCMLHGCWIHGRGTPPEGFTLVHVKWKLPDGEPFYPYFYRTEKMQISFPSQGEGWYWYPEFHAGFEAWGGYIDIIEWYSWQPSCNHKPFHWIGHYYATRQRWVKNPTEEWQRGGEKIIKLGLNSLYGKTAQQLGGTRNKPPSYHQLEWAGYITSATRARLYRAALTNPSAIIGFATDGLFSTRPLSLQCSTTKDIGAWELKEPLPIGITIAMAGVYWWHYPNAEYGHYSRGFDKDSMKTPDMVMQAWEKGLPEIDIPMHRLIGMGSACASDTLWKYRGCFTEGYRTLRLDGKSHKRQPCNVSREKPHKGLVDLEPSLNVEYGYGMQQCSHPYPVIWLDGQASEDYTEELEVSRETMDTENI